MTKLWADWILPVFGLNSCRALAKIVLSCCHRSHLVAWLPLYLFLRKWFTRSPLSALFHSDSLNHSLLFFWLSAATYWGAAVFLAPDILLYRKYNVIMTNLPLLSVTNIYWFVRSKWWQRSWGSPASSPSKPNSVSLSSNLNVSIRRALYFVLKTSPFSIAAVPQTPHVFPY